MDSIVTKLIVDAGMVLLTKGVELVRLWLSSSVKELTKEEVEVEIKRILSAEADQNAKEWALLKSDG